MIEQTNLVHDVLSLRTDFEVLPVTLGQPDDLDFLEYRWYSMPSDMKSAPAGADVIGQYQGLRWAGVRKH